MGIGAGRKHAAGVLLHDRRVRSQIFRRARVSDCRRSDMKPARSGVHIRIARSSCIRSRLCRHVWPQHLFRVDHAAELGLGREAQFQPLRSFPWFSIITSCG